VDFVMLFRWKQGLTRDQRDEALMRRAQWRFPQGVEPVAEYWPAAEDPAVVAIVRADDFAGLMEIDLTWGDLFDVTSLPAISAEDGMQVGPEVMQRRQL
jgi:hypothetical protein